MADVFDFYVYDNRSIVHTSPEPIMQEDKDVAVWRFRIPKVLNNIDMSAWAWWFVYVNAKGQKFSELLTLNNDIDDPEEYSIADYSIGYGISKTPGGFTFALEAINTSQGGEISGEWHTRTYTHTVTPTLQGNQAEYAETESDVISALIIEVQNKVSQLVGGATPEPVSLIADMTDTKKVYLYVGEESGESTNYWYYHNGTQWVAGGIYASGLTIDPTFTVRGSIADAKLTGDALAGKVAKPLTSPNGTNGQLLRTLGNGQTEWTDFATPTSEQVGEAVENWLDEHPEATTTVQDWSLTANKLVKGTLGFVMPEMFGAVGDGITDDTQAIKNCIDYAIENNLATHLLAKTYIISPSVLSFNIADGQSIVVDGQGQNTIIKLKDAGLDGEWSQLFTIVISPVSSKAHDVIFSNFCIDGNRRNQGEIAPDSYAYEASQMISIRGGSTGTLENGLYLDRFIVDNMRFYDPVADCVNISGTAQVGIRDVFLHRIVSTDRQGTRNDIGITGNPLHFVHISDCDCDSIHFEYNDTPADNLVIPYVISNCRFGKCTLAAKIDLHMSGCIITDDFLLGGMTSAKIANCDIYFTGDHYNVREATRTGVFVFESCKFKSGVYTNNNTQVLSSFYVYLCGRCTFLNCEFHYVGSVLDLDLDGDTEADHISGYAIDVNSSEKEPVIIDNCIFDKRYEFLLRHCGTNVILKNMVIDTGTAVHHYGLSGQASDTEYAEIEFDNIKLGRDCKYSIKIGNVANGTPTRAKGEIIALQSNFPMPYESSSSYIDKWMANVSGDFHRKVYVGEPLTLTTITAIASQKGYSSRDYFYLVKGDTFVYNGANPERYPEKWVVTDKGVTAIKNGNVAVGSPLEERIMSVGSGSGATADRPTCYLSKGFQYFDTELGKTICWNGTAWVDSAGTTV